MPQPKNDLSRSLVALDQHRTLIAVVELSLGSWLVGGIVPGIERDPLKKLAPDAEALLRLLHCWRDEAIKVGHAIERMVVAFEAGYDGFWLARWLRSRGIEAHVIHPTSVAVSREQRRAKTDRLDIGLLERSFLGWLRGEKNHCTMAAIPTLEEEDAKRPTREREHLVAKRTSIINRMKAALVSPWHPRLQPEIAQSTRTAFGAADARGMSDPSQHTGRAHARDGATAVRSRPDQADRGSSPSGTDETITATGAKLQGITVGANTRGWPRDGGYARP
jgi:hypothetical protein